MKTPPKPPFKLALAVLLMDGPPRSAEELLEALRPLYGAEKICALRTVASGLLNLKALGIVRPAEAGDRWELTRSGRERVLRAI